MNYSQELKIGVLYWPSQCPDFNITEYLWMYFKRAVHRKTSRSISELETLCRGRWKKKNLLKATEDWWQGETTRLWLIVGVSKYAVFNNHSLQGHFSLRRSTKSTNHTISPRRPNFYINRYFISGAPAYLNWYHVCFLCMPSFLPLLLMCTQCIVHQWIYSK